MENSPLLEILRTLPKERLKTFEKFVHSPFHVTHPGVVQLFEYLKHNLHAASLEQSTLLKAVGETDPRRIYHLTNYLLEAVEKFLALEQWEEQEPVHHLGTVTALRRLHLKGPFAGMLRYAHKRLKNSALRGADYYRSDYALSLEAYYGSLQQGRAKSFNLQELSDAQDIAFLCEKLRTGCLLLSHQAVSKQEYDKGLLDNTLQFLQGHRYLEIPAVAVYYHGYYAQLGGTDSDAHFGQLKILLQEHAGQFSLAEMHDLFLMAINFCIRRINQTQEHYFREVFDLYQSGLQHGALLEDGLLSRWTYNNITGTALRLREFTWVRHFLQEYAPFLPENHREGAFQFNLARYFYDTGDLRQAMQHLLQREHDDLLQNLIAKVMLCKIYYELGETDALENQLDSIQIYLRRKKVLGYHRDNYTAIIRFMRKLVALNFSDRAEVKSLKTAIHTTSILTEREWLLKQLD